MSNLENFISILESEFPEDRLTWQKNVPTFHPENADDASKLLKLANKHEQRIYITGFGNNIDPVGEPFTKMVSIRTDRLNKLTEINAPDFYIKVGAGYPLKELKDDLNSESLFLPHSHLPVDLSAELNGHQLPLRRYFIQAEVVTPAGDIIIPGSPCFKSVSGYDIVKIFAGSWGLLGLIVSATFRVLPMTAEHEYQSMKLNKVDRTKLLGALNESEKATDAVYSRKIKAKFDPVGVLPLV
jgi:FAD/FMN-containing dehydrogenase